MEPKSTVEVGKGDAEALLGLIDALEEHDDVNEVHANFDIPERDPRPRARRLSVARHRGRHPRRQNHVPMQVVMGIDPGAANLGFGVVRVEGNRMVALDGGVVETPPTCRSSAAWSGSTSSLAELLAWHEPKAMALEDIYFGKNVRSAMAVGQASGVAMLAAAAARRALLRLHAAGDQDGGLRLRRRRQGAGAADGRHPARPARAAQPRPRRRRARGGDLPRRRRRPQARRRGGRRRAERVAG